MRIMKLRPILVVLLLALAVVSAVVIACSSAPQCQPGTLHLEVELDQAAATADTVTFQSFVPPTSLTLPHTPTTTLTDMFAVDLTWPSGYPENRVVQVLVQALKNGQLLGENVATVHLLPGCSTGSVTVAAMTLDAGQED
jgi:hypothetical protein